VEYVVRRMLCAEQKGRGSTGGADGRSIDSEPALYVEVERKLDVRCGRSIAERHGSGGGDPKHQIGQTNGATGQPRLV